MVLEIFYELGPGRLIVSSFWEIQAVATIRSSLKGRFQGHRQQMGMSLEVNLPGLEKE